MKIFIYHFESKTGCIYLDVFVLASSETESDTYIEEFYNNNNNWDLRDYESLNIIVESDPKNKGIIHSIRYLPEFNKLDLEEIDCLVI